MVARVYIDGNEPRIICSKAGYEASPLLLDQDKTFDSNWYYGGGIRWILNAGLQGGQYNYTPFPNTLTQPPRVSSFITVQWFGNNLIFDGEITGTSPAEWSPPHGGWVLDSADNNNIARVDANGITSYQQLPPTHRYSGGRRVSVVFGD